MHLCASGSKLDNENCIAEADKFQKVKITCQILNFCEIYKTYFLNSQTKSDSLDFILL